MSREKPSRLSSRERYLQIALNSTLDEAHKIISSLPVSNRIILEAGTPLIKRYGAHGIRQIKRWYEERISGQALTPSIPTNNPTSLLSQIFDSLNQMQTTQPLKTAPFTPYIVADLKTMDRGETEVEIAAEAGASAAVALGAAPIETLNSFIEQCEAHGLDAMIDMMNVEFPLSVLRALKKIPRVVIIHRGVDEEKFNREKILPLHEIRRLKGNYNIMIAIAGGDTLREVQSAVFNDADIVVVWKSVYQQTGETAKLVEEFLKHVK
jgi:bifunctional enzyme Fae/Hps